MRVSIYNIDIFCLVSYFQRIIQKILMLFFLEVKRLDWRRLMSAVMPVTQDANEALTQQVIHAVRTYLNTVSSKDVNLNLYQLIIEEIESPLFRTVMEMTRYNQSKAARVLGVSRGTLRTKLKRYFDDEFIGTREF